MKFSAAANPGDGALCRRRLGAVRLRGQPPQTRSSPASHDQKQFAADARFERPRPACAPEVRRHGRPHEPRCDLARGARRLGIVRRTWLPERLRSRSFDQRHLDSCLAPSERLVVECAPLPDLRDREQRVWRSRPTRRSRRGRGAVLNRADDQRHLAGHDRLGVELPAGFVVDDRRFRRAAASRCKTPKSGGVRKLLLRVDRSVRHEVRIRPSGRD